MKTKAVMFRFGVILLFLLGMVSPLATTTTGAEATAQAVTCDDFSTREEAQEAFDDDPDTAETLDEDGDGIACEDLPTEAEATSDDGVNVEDVQLPGDDDEATEEATEEPTEEATAEDEEPTEEATTEDEPASGDVDDYLATVQDEADDLQTSVDRFIEIDDEAAGDPTQAELRDLADEANEIAATWADYPDVAAEITAPDGVEEIDTAYQDLAETTGQTGEDWALYWDTPEDTPEEDDAFDAFSESFSTMQDQLES
ncbi:MAG: excalibur calcium-binding domain-containing protein, partial [Chloroflexota bacterium]|nr:excalibur calcium-binding domain-containing protein [Chloroflexota bacterium]